VALLMLSPFQGLFWFSYLKRALPFILAFALSALVVVFLSKKGAALYFGFCPFRAAKFQENC